MAQKITLTELKKLVKQVINESDFDDENFMSEEEYLKELESIIAKHVLNYEQIQKEMSNYKMMGYNGFSDKLKNALRHDMDFETLSTIMHDQQSFRRERGL